MLRTRISVVLAVTLLFYGCASQRQIGQRTMERVDQVSFSDQRTEGRVFKIIYEANMTYTVTTEEKMEGHLLFASRDDALQRQIADRFGEPWPGSFLGSLSEQAVISTMAIDKKGRLPFSRRTVSILGSGGANGISLKDAAELMG
jgi:hypothetical protein